MSDFSKVIATADRISAMLGEMDCCSVDGIKIKGVALAAALDRRIDDDNRGATIRRMANAAGISESTVGQILNGSINCPPRNRLEGFARVLGVSVSSLISAAERDGCNYDNDGE